MAWIVGSPLLAVLVGKMISLGDRLPAALPSGAAAAVAPASRPEAAPSRLGAEAAA